MKFNFCLYFYLLPLPLPLPYAFIFPFVFTFTFTSCLYLYPYLMPLSFLLSLPLLLPLAFTFTSQRNGYYSSLALSIWRTNNVSWYCNAPRGSGIVIWGGGRGGRKNKLCFIEEINRTMSTWPQLSVSRKGSQCMVTKREQQLNYIRCGILCVYLLPPHHRINPLPSNFVYQQPSFSCIGAQKKIFPSNFALEIVIVRREKPVNVIRCNDLCKICSYFCSTKQQM